MLASYLPIAFMLILAGAFGIVTVTAARALGPKDPTPEKRMPYECGITEIDPTVERFPVRFYLVAMLFVIFDVEVILFFPWAVSFRSFPAFSLIAMSVFVGLLLVAFVYEWRNGGLEWD
ncbi:MAG TPA: NADH-quinone oxidoreductase subunit A [Actinomycetota bacterium]|jgi:NADH-quinone oxidoreductase subunit A|nr:NADH-quinone oxidoreductase subunit A [Actinomycetota bacterium]